MNDVMYVTVWTTILSVMALVAFRTGRAIRASRDAKRALMDAHAELDDHVKDVAYSMSATDIENLRERYTAAKAHAPESEMVHFDRKFDECIAELADIIEEFNATAQQITFSRGGDASALRARVDSMNNTVKELTGTAEELILDAADQSHMNTVEGVTEHLDRVAEAADTLQGHLNEARELGYNVPAVGHDTDISAIRDTVRDIREVSDPHEARRKITTTLSPLVNDITPRIMEVGGTVDFLEKAHLVVDDNVSNLEPNLSRLSDADAAPYRDRIRSARRRAERVLGTFGRVNPLTGETPPPKKPDNPKTISSVYRTVRRVMRDLEQIKLDLDARTK